MSRPFVHLAWVLIVIAGSTNTQATILAIQDFDGGSPAWGVTLDPDPTQVGVFDAPSAFGVVTQIENFVFGSGQFLGVRDATNPTNPRGDSVKAIFDPVSLAGHSAAVLSFDYEVRSFDPGDSVTYEVFLDGIGQGEIPLVLGQSPGQIVIDTHTIAVPETASTMSLELTITQNGLGDYAGFDNFQVSAIRVIPEPTYALGVLAVAGRGRRRTRVKAGWTRF